MDRPNFLFSRKDGKAFKVLARGDCTSRRTVHLNPQMFKNGVNFIQDQKSPFILHLEAAEGISVTTEDLKNISNISEMPGSLSVHYLSQADRQVLSETDADLIIIDTWADINFDLWRSNEHGWQCWIHPKFLKDPDWFYNNFTKMGKRSFEQSVADAAAFIEILRLKNQNTPVLILNQQIDYYSKMEPRRFYYDFGKVLEDRLDNAFFGGIIRKENLELADIGSCGPDQTLHFQASTYFSMVETALSKGLDKFGVSATTGLQRRYAADNKERLDYPVGAISFGFSKDHPPEKCGGPEKKVHDNLKSYIDIEGVTEELRWTPVTIEIPEDSDYPEWERRVKKKYDRIRMKKKSEKTGCIIHPFHWKLHIPDAYEIHNSAAARSGGEMRGDYLNSIEDMGGYPTRHWLPLPPKCPIHWNSSIGVFLPKEGHMQGDFTVDEKLIGYINLRRNGDLLLYSRIMGHLDHLNNGAMYHLHFDIVRRIFENDSKSFNGIKHIMYGGIGNGGANLWQWKRTVGFEPKYLFSAAGAE